MKKTVFAILGFFLLWAIQGELWPAQNQFIHLNKVAAKLEAGRLITGIWVQSVNLSAAIGLVEFNGYPDKKEALEKPMIDFILVEMEHEPFDISELRSFLLGLNSKREVLVRGDLQPSLTVFVRLPVEGGEQVHAMIKQALDIGVHGVVIPHVQTAQDAQKIVEACRYPQAKNSRYPKPRGTRGASPWVCSYLWGLTMPEYVARADVWPLNPQGDLMTIVMIEDEEGLKNIDSILKVPGIGAVMFGPYDFSFAAGLAGNSSAPLIKETWKKVKAAADRAGVPLVGFADLSNVEDLIKEKYRMMLIGTNVDLSGGPGKIIDLLRAKFWKR